MRLARRKEIQDVDNADPHAPNARTPATLLWVNRYSVSEFCHDALGLRSHES
jgi:hypothetical protein